MPAFTPYIHHSTNKSIVLWPARLRTWEREASVCRSEKVAR